MLNAIQQGILTSSTKKRLETLERQKENLQTAIAQAGLQKPKYTKEQIVIWINQSKEAKIIAEQPITPTQLQPVITANAPKTLSDVYA